MVETRGCAALSLLLAARLPSEMREVADEQASSGTVDCLVRLIYDEADDIYGLKRGEGEMSLTASSFMLKETTS